MKDNQNPQQESILLSQGLVNDNLCVKIWT